MSAALLIQGQVITIDGREVIGTSSDLLNTIRQFVEEDRGTVADPNVDLTMSLKLIDQFGGQLLGYDEIPYDPSVDY
jgi:hypothetical protein